MSNDANRDLSSKLGLDTTDFKTGIAAANRELRVLESGFRASAAGMGDWANTATGLESRIKSLNSQMDIQKLKVAALTAEHQKLVDAGKGNSATAKELEIRINKETESLNKMQTELGETEKSLEEVKKGNDAAGKSTEDMGKKSKTTEGQLNGLKTALRGVAEGVKLMAQAMLAAVGIIAAVAAAITGLVISSADAADKLAELSAQTRISTDKLQEMQFTGALLGTSLETFTGSQTKLIRAMQAARDGTGGQADAFAALGIRVTDTNGQLRDSQVVFGEAIDALKQIKNPTEQDAAAMAIFGKSAQELNPLIAVGSEGLKKYAQQAHDVGAVVDSDTVQALSGFKDKLDTIQLGLKGTATTVAASFLPAFDGLADEVMVTLQGVHQVVQDSNGDLVAMAKGIITLIGQELKVAAKTAPEMLQAGAEMLKSITSAVIKGLPLMIPAAQSLIKTFVGFLGQALPLMFGLGAQIVLAVISSLLPALPGLITAALDVILTLADALTKALPELLPVAAQTIVTIANELVARAPQLIAAAIELLTALAKGLTGALNVLTPALPLIIKALTDGLLANKQELGIAAGELLGALASALVASSSITTEALTEVARLLVAAIPALLRGVGLELAAAVIAGFWLAVGDAWTKGWNDHIAAMQKEFAEGDAGWHNFYAGLGRTAAQYFTDADAKLASFYAGQFRAAVQHFTNSDTSLRNFYVNLGRTAIQYFSDADAGLRNFYAEQWNAVTQYFSDSENGWDNFYGGLGNIFNQGISDLKSKWDGFLLDIVEKAQGIANDLYNAGSTLIANMWKGIQDGWADLIAGLQGLINQLPSAIQNLLGTSSDIGNSLGASIGAGMIAGMDQQMRAAIGGLTPAAATGGAGGGGSVSHSESFGLTNYGTIHIGAQTPSGIAKEIKDQARRF